MHSRPGCGTLGRVNHLAYPRPVAAARGASSVLVVVVIVVVIAAAIAVGVLTQTRGPAAPDPAKAQADIELLAQKLSLAIQNQRDTRVLLEPAKQLAQRYEGFASAHTLYGQALMHNGQLRPAAAQLRQALALEPDHAQAHALLGAVHIQLEAYDAARSNLQQAISLDDQNPAHRVKLANLELLAGDLPAAERAALDALRLNSKQHQAYVVLSHVAEQRKQLDLAQQQMGKAIDALPGEEEANRIAYVRRRAKLLRRDNRPQDALAALRALPPQLLFRMEVADDTAVTYGMMSQPASAAQVYVSVLHIQQVNDRAMAEAARWYLKAGLRDEAREMVERLTRVNPRYPDLNDLRRQLATPQ